MQNKMQTGDECLVILFDEKGRRFSLLGIVEAVQVSKGGGSETIPRITDAALAILAEPSLATLLGKTLRGGKTKNFSYYVARRP